MIPPSRLEELTVTFEIFGILLSFRIHLLLVRSRREIRHRPNERKREGSERRGGRGREGRGWRRLERAFRNWIPKQSKSIRKSFGPPHLQTTTYCSLPSLPFLPPSTLLSTMSSSGSDSDSSSKIDAPQTTKKGSKKSAPSAAPAVVDKGKGKSKATISSDEEEESSDESSDDDDDDDEMAGRSARPAVIKVSKDL